MQQELCAEKIKPGSLNDIRVQFQKPSVICPMKNDYDTFDGVPNKKIIRIEHMQHTPMKRQKRRFFRQLQLKSPIQQQEKLKESSI